MKGAIMTSIQKPIEHIIYTVGGRNVALNKTMVDEYSDIVCPVTESFLQGMINVLGKNCKDNVLSYKIELDMAQELQEYA